MNKHVQLAHEATEKEINMVCGFCKHQFIEKDDYNQHVKTHDEQARDNLMLKAVTNENIDVTEDRLSDPSHKASIVVLSDEEEETVCTVKPVENSEKENPMEFKCTNC